MINISRKLRIAYDKLENYKLQGHSHEEAVNLVSIELSSTSDAHCRAFLVQSAFTIIEKTSSELSPALVDVLKLIVNLFAVETCFKSLADLIRVCLIRVRKFLLWL